MSTALDRARDAYALLVRCASSLRSPLLLALRLYWGSAFFLAGLGKLRNLSVPTEFFTTLGIPFPAFNAVLAGSAECFGGLLLLVGLASRLAALPLIFTMLVAYLTADLAVVKNVFADPDAFTSAAPFLYLLTALLVFVFGPGAFSLDYLLGKKFAPRASTTTAAPPAA